MMKRYCLGLVAALSGCGDDLPEGWERATKIPIEQSACTEVMPEAPITNMSVGLTNETVSVAFRTTRVRCEQEACAYYQSKDSVEQFLVQPCDMHPSQVTLCMCTYDLSFGAGVGRAEADVELYMRGDAYANDPPPPELIYSGHVPAP